MTQTEHVARMTIGSTAVFWETTLGQVDDLINKFVHPIPPDAYQLSLFAYGNCSNEKKNGLNMKEETRLYLDKIVAALITDQVNNRHDSYEFYKATVVPNLAEEAQMMVSRVTAQHYQESVTERLDRLNVSYDQKVLEYIRNKEHSTYLLLLNPYVTKKECTTLISSARSKSRASSQKLLGLHHGIFINGLLASGQTKSSIYYAFTQSGGVVAAKVYSSGYKTDFDRETKVSAALEDHPNVVPFLQTFSLEDDRNVIIMPFYPRSVSDMLLQYPTSVPLATVTVVARDCSLALRHIHSKGFCFMDLKPSNIMLSGSVNGCATLVDLGAAVRTNDFTIEVSKSYCLDEDTTTASERIDWVCLGTTLAEMMQISTEKTKREMIDSVKRYDILDTVKEVIINCLEVSVEGVIMSVDKLCKEIIESKK